MDCFIQKHLSCTICLLDEMFFNAKADDALPLKSEIFLSNHFHENPINRHHKAHHPNGAIRDRNGNLLFGG
jgi:hypothetical protein